MGLFCLDLEGHLCGFAAKRHTPCNFQGATFRVSIKYGQHSLAGSYKVFDPSLVGGCYILIILSAGPGLTS